MLQTILKIRWVDRIANIEVLRRLQKEPAQISRISYERRDICIIVEHNAREDRRTKKPKPQEDVLDEESKGMVWMHHKRTVQETREYD